MLSAGTLPVAQLFMSHHQQHADAFGAVAGDKKATGPNAKLIAALTPTLQGIKDEMAALEFAFTLEGQAAYTYAAALTLLQDPAYAAATSTILPIEAQHQVVLGLALGKSVVRRLPDRSVRVQPSSATAPIRSPVSIPPSSPADPGTHRRTMTMNPNDLSNDEHPPRAARDRPHEHRGDAEVA